MTQVIMAYIPVLHQGYLNFLHAYPDVETVYLFGKDILVDFPELRKDIRALNPEDMMLALSQLKLKPNFKVLSKSDLDSFKTEQVKIIMPDEDVSRAVIDKHFSTADVEFASIFLRWDKSNILKEKDIQADEVIDGDQFQQRFMQEASQLAQKSADWWRQVGAVIVKDNLVIMKDYNHHVPDAQQPYYDGDPRASFHKGDHIELSTAMHAEASLIAEAAQIGMSLQGASLYVTTFPCPVCAKLVAYSGIKEVFYAEGYAMLDGELILKTGGVKIIKLKGG